MSVATQLSALRDDLATSENNWYAFIASGRKGRIAAARLTPLVRLRRMAGSVKRAAEMIEA